MMDKEKKQEYNRRYYQKNKATATQKACQYHHAHKEQRNQYSKQYYQTHKERERQRRKKYYQEHKEQYRQRYFNSCLNKIRSVLNESGT